MSFSPCDCLQSFKENRTLDSSCFSVYTCVFSILWFFRSQINMSVFLRAHSEVAHLRCSSRYSVLWGWTLLGGEDFLISFLAFIVYAVFHKTVSTKDSLTVFDSVIIRHYCLMCSDELWDTVCTVCRDSLSILNYTQSSRAIRKCECVSGTRGGGRSSWA